MKAIINKKGNISLNNINKIINKNKKLKENKSNNNQTNIIKLIKNKNKNKIRQKDIKKKDKKNQSPPLKKGIKLTKSNAINVIQTNNILQKNNINSNDNSKSHIITTNIDKISKKIMKLNIYELNNLSYKEALKKDKRSYIKYYISLLKTRHLILFSFCPLKDYNSRIIKISLFFFSFTIYLTVNALFFNDSTMHKIYIDDGDYNLSYQIVQIVYSSLISSVLNIILKTFSLSEQNILDIKHYKNNQKIKRKVEKVIRILSYKFFIFFIISSIFLLLFWYYISSFCAVYENTQIHFIKDTLISFGLSMMYPFIIYLIPGFFRIPSLKKSGRENMYKFSKFIQLI